MERVSPADVAGLFDLQVKDLAKEVLEAIGNADLRYTRLVGPEREACILKVLQTLDSGELVPVGPQRLARWEEGWRENLEGYLESGGSWESLLPKYFKPGVFRYQGDFIRPVSDRFEADFVQILRRILFERELADADAVIEFGCGTGTSLILLAELFPQKRLIGSDWTQASQGILKAVSKKIGREIQGIQFDMFSPNDSVPFSDRCAVITMNSMEQLGSGHQNFLNYLLAKKPYRCVHLEPIVELYEEDNLFDHLAKAYHQRRSYLSGFLPALQGLEATGKIRVEWVKRFRFGSLYQEAYSAVVWRPLS